MAIQMDYFPLIVKAQVQQPKTALETVYCEMDLICTFQSMI